MTQPIFPARAERLRVDQARVDLLVRQLGPSAAENVICRALEELAVRLAHAERLHRRGDMAGMRKALRSLSGIADQIGLADLAAVAGHAIRCLDRGDAVALAAITARLVRVGEASLTAIWDLDDLSV